MFLKKELAKEIKNPEIVLLSVWGIIQVILFFHNGIVTKLEATKYINEANHFIDTGKMSTNNFYLYSTQILLIALAFKLKLGFIYIIIIQWGLNLLATFSFYKLGKSILKDDRYAFLATLLLILSLPYQAYNSFLYTESIFFSLTIIYTSYLLRIKEFSFTHGVVILLSLGLLSFTRPTGILFFGASAFYLYFRYLNHWSIPKKLLMLIPILIIFILVTNSMIQSGGELNLMLPFIRENILCGVNTTSHAGIILLENDNSLLGLVYYIFHNPIHFLKLASWKTVSFFSNTREHYSLLHNILILLFYVPIYMMAIYVLFRERKGGSFENRFFYSIIFLFWFTTILTCDDWHGRWFLTISPFLYLIALQFFLVYPRKRMSKVQG